MLRAIVLATFEFDAHASTLRTTVGYETSPYRGLSLQLEAENVRPVGDDLYDNRGAAHRHNERPERPVLADPGLTQVNQAALRFAPDDGTLVTLGRQEILLDDQRSSAPSAGARITSRSMPRVS